MALGYPSHNGEWVRDKVTGLAAGVSGLVGVRGKVLAQSQLEAQLPWLSEQALQPDKRLLCLLFFQKKHKLVGAPALHLLMPPQMPAGTGSINECSIS